MIGGLKGIVEGKGTDEALIFVGGVIYLVHCGARTLSRMPTVGDPVHLHIETYVREDQLKLFGFLSEEDRAWFVRLQNVQGVGAKVALAILDVLTPAALMQAIELEDKAAVSQANGVGPRVAARIVTDLKGKPLPTLRDVSAPRSGSVPAGDGPSTTGANAQTRAEQGSLPAMGDITGALTALGIGESDARQAAARVLRDAPETATLEALIKEALKSLGGR